MPALEIKLPIRQILWDRFLLCEPYRSSTSPERRPGSGTGFSHALAHDLSQTTSVVRHVTFLLLVLHHQHVLAVEDAHAKPDLDDPQIPPPSPCPPPDRQK